MRRLLAPGLDAPDITAIEEFVRAPEDGPRKLQGLITTDLPTAADFPYGVVFDTTVGKPKFSDGSTWSLFGPSNAAGLSYTPTGNIAATNVQAAIDELDTEKQPLDGDLTALAALSGTSTIYYRSGTSTWTAVTIGGTLSFSAGTLALNLNSANSWTATQTNSGGWHSTSTTAKIGYATGAGGTVTQNTNKSTSVTLDKVCGDITMNNATLNAGATVAFGLSSSAMAAGDMVVVALKNGSAAGGGNDYQVWATGPTGGSCTIHVKNNSAGNLSEAIVIRFFVLKAVTS